MNNRLQTLLDRLPSHFVKDDDSNNYKLLSIIAENSNENRRIYDTILKFWDMNQSEGVGLDRLGKDEGISRGGMDDEEYRKMIKIQCVVNLSEGDIPTMNIILDAYMGDSFIGFQDGWKAFEPASLLAHIKKVPKHLPINLVKRIKPVGVKIYWILEQIVGAIHLQMISHSFDVMYPICNMFQTDTLPGKLANATIQGSLSQYEFDTYFPICNTFVTSTLNSVESQLNVELTHEYRDIDVLYPRASQQTVVGEGEI